MSHRHSFDRELESARRYYSAYGVGVVLFGAFVAVVGRLSVVGFMVMGIGAVFALLGTIAPASICLRVATADEEYKSMKRIEDEDGEI